MLRRWLQVALVLLAGLVRPACCCGVPGMPELRGERADVGAQREPGCCSESEREHRESSPRGDERCICSGHAAVRSMPAPERPVLDPRLLVTGTLALADLVPAAAAVPPAHVERVAHPPPRPLPLLYRTLRI
jgi:hypothetical protein